jgi:hypothetical protein
MTLLDADPGRPAVLWASPENDLWVGHASAGSGPVYAGFVERRGSTFLAHDGAGRQVGCFRTLREAQQVLD